MVIRSMINNFVYSFFFVALVLAGSFEVRAQNCAAAQEMIINLRNPGLGSYSVWDTIYGEKTEAEAFKDGMLLDNGHVLIMGEVSSAVAGDDIKFLLAEVKKNGRVSWDKLHEIPGLKSVVSMQPHKKGALVLGHRMNDKNRKVLWLGVFDLSGALVSQSDVAHMRGALEAFDLVRMSDKGRYMVAAALHDKNLSVAASGILYVVNDEGRVVDDQAFITGYENRIFGLSALPGGDVLATGYLFLADGRKAGWILRLGSSGEIEWQRQYPRGAGAQLRTGQAYADNTLLVVGTALPSGREGHRAGWLMVVDASNGTIGWQRYYISDGLGYLGRDLLVSDDHLITVLLDGETPMSGPVEDGETGALIPEHVQLLTLNPRGQIFIAEGYYNGEGADAYRLMFGPNFERVMIGGSDMKYTIEDPDAPPEAEPEIIETPEAWMAAAVAMEPYEDPCVQPARFLP